MPHIHTESGQHDTTVSAYILRLDGLEPTLLLHMHKKLNKYLQFGGHIELHETPWDAILHEIIEESGYKSNQLKILQPKNRLKSLSNSNLHPYPVSIQTFPYGDLDHYHTDITYAFVTYSLPLERISNNESKDILCFTRKELANSDEIPDEVKEIGLFIMDECLRNWEKVSL